MNKHTKKELQLWFSLRGKERHYKQFQFQRTVTKITKTIILTIKPGYIYRHDKNINHLKCAKKNT